MTAGGRPNLAGLFDGSTPPERSGRAGPTPGQRRGALSAVAQTHTPTDPETDRTTAPLAPDTSRRPSAGPLAWADPMRVALWYFDALAHLLDAHRRITLSVLSSITALPERVRSGR